ncbi:hypothetical protein [Actinokineospora terrae]|uniref:hypothetical protein n=1 Tax=Actinokineospora terrae TaxID=155974 RepID=UPI000B8602B1|nr:hypothetical protein [Actinokineospora terrae]
MTVLPFTTGYLGARASAINDAGDSVGYAYDRDYSTRALSWNKNGEVTPLTVPGSPDVGASDINERGTILGQAYVNSTQFYRAVRWDRGRATLLQPLAGDAYTSATALTDSDLVVGTSSGGPSGQDGVPVVWDRAGAAKALRLLPNSRLSLVYGAAGTTAYGIIITTDEVLHPVRWDLARDGALAPLPAQDAAYPQAANNRGTVVGFTRHQDVNSAATWPRRGPATTLTPLPGDQSAHADAVNDANEVAGISGSNHAVLWNASGHATALTPPTGSVSQITDITERGSVLGTAYLPNQNQRAILWPARR